MIVPLAQSIEFYYMLSKGSEQCFEEHLGGQTLVTGEVFYGRPGSLTLTVSNPKDSRILLKACFNIIFAELTFNNNIDS